MNLLLASLSRAARRYGALLGIVATLTLSLLLYLVDIQSNPPYYVDEATNAYLGRAKLESLLSGAPMRIGPIRYADYPRMSGYTFLVGLAGRVAGAPEFGSRYLSALSGVAFALFVLLVARKQLTSRLAIVVVMASLLSSRVVLLEFRYGFSSELLAASLMATYYFSLLLLSSQEASLKKRVGCILAASLSASLTLLNEMLTGGLAYALLLMLVGVSYLRSRRRNRNDLLLLAIPAALLLLAFAAMLSNPLFLEEVSRISRIRNPLGRGTPMPLSRDLVAGVMASPVIRMERVFLAIALGAMLFSMASMVRRREGEQLLAYAPLLAPFIFITAVLRDMHFSIRAFSMYFPVLFASVIHAVRCLERAQFWRRPGWRTISFPASILLGIGLLVGSGERVRAMHAYFAKPLRYFNDIPFDESFAGVVADLNASVPRDRVVLLPPHLLPFVDHPYTTDYFLSQLCAGKRHPDYAPDATLLGRRLYPCSLDDVHVAVLHPVFYAHEAGLWPDGPDFVNRVLTTWKPMANIGSFALFQNPGPSAPPVVRFDPGR